MTERDGLVNQPKLRSGENLGRKGISKLLTYTINIADKKVGLLNQHRH